ncbi:iron-siderophore ABC transporter substrate-binding protein [Streptomyces sp. 8K308]|uniref:ABC transporter substrate-binding protein n=1 Tax=Streptomyces sp. 8K308 TaxID=2530388 RepID=UPI001FB68D21|nr:iron-siderophore ABC transporter substrate-binding protein [Streptomyces sp. 8K308]
MISTLNRSGRRRGRLATLLLSLAMAGALTACGGSEDDGAADDPAASAGASDAAYPRTITHDKGETVLEARPERIVALDNSLVEAVVTLDGNLVGGISSYRDLGGFPEYLGDAVAETEEVGPLESPNLELIASLQPDLIISATVRHDDLYDQLSAIAPTVFVATTGPSWKENIELVAEALNEEDSAAEQIAAYESRAAAIGAAVNEELGDPTVSIVRFLDGPTRIYLPKTFSGIILSDMGLARPENQRDPEEFNIEISEEQIEQANADVLFYTSYSGGEERRERFLANPLWERLTAVQNGHAYEVRDEIWMTSVSLQGANQVLDDMAEIFGVDDAR